MPTKTAKKSTAKKAPTKAGTTDADPKGYFDPSVLGPNRQARRSDPTGQDRTLDALGNERS